MERIDTKQTKGYGRLFPLVALGLGALLGAIALKDSISFQALADNREALLAFRDDNYLFAVLLFLMAYTVIVAFSLPGATIATLTGGFLFATFPGVLFNMTGATLGAIGIFLAARMGLGEKLSAKMSQNGGAIAKIKQGLEENQWSMLFSMRLIPVVPFFVANLVPAFLNVPLRRYAISTFLGIFPGALVYTSVGAGLGQVFAAGEVPDLGIIFEPHVLLPLLGLAALSLAPVLIKFIRGKTAS